MAITFQVLIKLRSLLKLKTNLDVTMALAELKILLKLTLDQVSIISQCLLVFRQIVEELFLVQRNKNLKAIQTCSQS